MPREGLSDLSLFYPVLAEFIVDINEDGVRAREDDENKSDRFYDVALQSTEGVHKNFSVATCAFSAGKKIKETKVIEVKATYFVGMTKSEALSESDRRHMLEEMAASSAWSMFRSAFSHIASQTGLELPLLPNVPKVRWLEAKKGRKSKPKSKSE